ncbi:MAG: hypothetical protein U0K51_08705 [Segatella copri]|nr:hypothetical protein [Segatella copri]
MEQKDIDIYEILKDVPTGTKFYTSLCGNVGLAYLEFNKEAGEAIWTENKDGEYSFNKNGRWMEGGEVMLFPSNEMRDWSKFFKKGDVLEYVGDKKLQVTCTFEKYEDETKTRFFGRFVKEKEVLNPNLSANYRTVDWVKKHNPAGYIRFVEERLGGKLNRETLEIENAHPEFKDGDIVVAEEDNYYDMVIFIAAIKDDIVSKALINVRYEDYEVNYDEYRFGHNRNLRLATDSEKKQLFSALKKEGKRWDSEKKQIVDLKPAFEIGKLYVFNEEDEDGELTIIGKLIDKNESEDTLTFGNQYEIETEKFVTDQAFDLRISVNEELREATENEAITFQEAYTQWVEKEKKAMKAKEKPAFKTFDKVLVRDEKENEWIPALFVRDRGEGANYRYEALSIQSGKTWGFTSCIPFDGHENIAFTTYDIENLPF